MAETGKLIVLEAVDDAVLGLLSGELGRWLRENGLLVEETREPTYGPAGTQILLARQGRLHFDAKSLALLYLADRLDHLQSEGGMESSLKAGQHVVCSHYGLAAASHLWEKVEWDWSCRINALCRAPDLTLYVDLVSEKPLQKRLRESYLAAIQCFRDNGHDVVVVDGNDTLLQTSLTCKRHVARLLKL